jgi:hypothetical protein
MRVGGLDRRFGLSFELATGGVPVLVLPAFLATVAHPELVGELADSVFVDAFRLIVHVDPP